MLQLRGRCLMNIKIHTVDHIRGIFIGHCFNKLYAVKIMFSWVIHI